MQSSDGRVPSRAAVLFFGTRADLGRFRIAAASLRRHAPAVDGYTLAVDALPGDAAAIGAGSLDPSSFVSYERLMGLAYSSTPSELCDALLPEAVRALTRLGYDAVVALPARSFVSSSLDPLFARLESSDIVPDPGFALGWWGFRRGADRRVTVHHPAAAELVDYGSADRRAVAQAGVVLFHDLPPAPHHDVARVFFDAADGAAAVEHAYRDAWSAVNGGERGPSYRYAAFSNGAPVDRACRALLRKALAEGERFGDPGDVRAAASFFAWLTAPAAAGQRLSRYMERYVALRPSLRRAFPRCAARPEPLLAHVRRTQPADLDPVWYRADPLLPLALRDPVPGSAGVNLVGYFRAELGIGEAGRSIASALRVAGVPHALLDFSTESLNRPGDTSISVFDRGPRYEISVMCANPDQFDVFDRHSASAAFAGGRYRIGAWWFELPDLPVEWLTRLARVDELWAGSRFVEAALMRVAPVPVTYIPPVIEPRPGAPVSRAEFGLADDELAYLFVFDFNSIWERKNPDGVVAAFRRAFEGSGRARLILKTINAPLHPEGYRRLQGIVGGDPRIRLVDEYYDRDRLARLMRACDAYVSLHRAEGFGLTIAEAMLCGKPVVATRWSGNMDFTTAGNSFLVEGRLVRIERDHGPYYAGGLWAEPDLDGAAAALRSIAEHPGEAAHRAALGQLDVRSLFSAARVGSLVRARIDAIAALRKVCA